MILPTCCRCLMGISAGSSLGKRRRQGQGSTFATILSTFLLTFVIFGILVQHTHGDTGLADDTSSSSDPFGGGDGDGDDGGGGDGGVSPTQTWPPAHKFAINSDEDAKKYLIKYGYMQCSIDRPRERRQAPLDLVTEEEVDTVHREEPCTSDVVKSAIKKFQASKGLKPTGQLDKPTIELMRQRRCGNKDTVAPMPPLSVLAPSLDGLALAANTSSSTADSSGSASSAAGTASTAAGAGGTSSGSSVRKRRSAHDVIAAWKRERRSVRAAVSQQQRRLDEHHRQQETQNMQHLHAMLADVQEDKTRYPKRKRKRRDVRDVLKTGDDAKNILNKILQPEPDPHPHQHRMDQLQDIQEQLLKNRNVTGKRTPRSVDNSPPSVRTKEQLEEHARKLRKHVYFRDEHDTAPVHHEGPEPHVVRRVKRSFDNDVVDGGHGYIFNTDRPVTWQITQQSDRVPWYEQESILHLAFRMWSEVIPIQFRCHDPSSWEEADVQVAFHKGEIEFANERHHQIICPNWFDGQGGELAHTLLLVYMHFDDTENYKSHITEAGVYLLKVFLHEIGHVIGLSHNNNNESLLFPIYNAPDPQKGIELPVFDRRQAQIYYGKCETTFSVVYDHLRRQLCIYDPNEQPCLYKYVYKYNSYFFKDDMYWLYENKEGRPRHGDPHPIMTGWSGLGNDIDGAVQTFAVKTIMFRENLINVYEITTMFFKGEYVYYYNEDEQRVVDTKPIREVFGPKPGQSEGVPNNIDSVYRDARGGEHLFFFKGDWVWEVDPHAPEGQQGCCESKVKFTDMFPMYPPDNYTRYIKDDVVPPLTGSPDAVWHSYPYRTLFFLKGQYVWENHPYSVWDPATGKHQGYGAPDQNELWFRGNINEYWNDLCDVADTPYTC